MQKKLWGLMLALVSLIGVVAISAAPSQAVANEGGTTAPNSAQPRPYPEGLPNGVQVPNSVAPNDTCGRGNPLNAVPDGARGWYIGWRNCWGQNGIGVAPTWFNGIGNTYANVRTSSGGNRCYPIPNDGTVWWWHIPEHELPLENTNYTGVIYCLDY